MKYIYTIVLLILLVPACTTIPLNQVIGAPAGLDIPGRRSGEVDTVTSVSECYVDEKATISGTFNIEEVSFDTKPDWKVYEYVGYYLYGEDTPFVVSKFDEDGNIIANELFGKVIKFEELISLYSAPCDAARAVYNRTSV